MQLTPRPRNVSLSITWLLFAVLLVSARAASSQAQETSVRAVPTFECMGLYLDVPTNQGECHVRYRKAGTPEWHVGLPLVYDARDQQYRGSLVGLSPGTEYELRLEYGDRQVDLTGRTRTAHISIGRTTHLPGGETNEPLRITVPGTSAAWHLVTPAPRSKSVVDVFNLHDTCVEVAADYVVVRGLQLQNAGRHAVLIRRGVQHVVIEDCHMTGWGRIGGARVWGIRHGSDSAIYAESGAGQLLVQRNLIVHPRSGANDWESGHPDGPQAITLINSSGGNVIRYNEIRSTEDHGYNDGIGGSSNFSFQGSPNRDSDIYGNVITNCWDDAIESEGANMNVRIWGNYIDKTFAFIATAATAKGPLYVFRNVFATSRVSHQDSSGGVIIKTGLKRQTVAGKPVTIGLGRRFIFHNTALQPNGALNVFSGHELHNAVSRNNIFRVRGRIYPTARGTGPPNDFQHDLTTSYLGGGSVRSMFVPSERLEWFLRPMVPAIKWGRVEFTHDGQRITITDPVVAKPNAAIDAGVVIPGFNDDFQGKAPDLGAFENGNPPLRFGREAAPGFARAPWEVY